MAAKPKAPSGAARLESKERDGATVTGTGSAKPALRQALQARGPDLDLIRELPSGPAACEPHQRPHTCQHPTARCTNPENSSCAKVGVHTCRKVKMVVKGTGRGWGFRGEPNLKTALIRPFLGLLRNFATGPNARAMVRQFITLLRGLAMELGSAVVVTLHPSLTGITTRTGLSGNTPFC